jgi:Protein of unknown function DUF262.
MIKIIKFDPKTLRSWYSIRNEIDFNPPYQRQDRLWSPGDKAYLIDSILNHYDIPKLYLADYNILHSYPEFRKLNKKSLPYAIIDGKQRFHAIFDFFDNHVPLDFSFVYLKDKSIPLAGLTYSQIKAKYPFVAQEYEDYLLDIASVITDDPLQINELFLRLNRSKPLTEAEIRSAMRGIVPHMIEDISTHEFFREKISFDTKRAQHKSVAAKLLLLEFRGRLVDISEYKVDRFVEEGISLETSNLSPVFNRLMGVLDHMSKVFDKKDSLLSSPKRIPIYYWFIRSHFRSRTIHQFLEYFERNRDTNNKKARSTRSQIDQVLLIFDLVEAENPDSLDSLMTRYQIIEEKYDYFRKG